MTISFRAADVQNLMIPGVIGLLVDADSAECETIINSDPQALKTYTVVVGTQANSRAYSYTVDGTTVSYTSDASGTKAEICNGLAAAHLVAPGARGQYTATSDGVDTVTLVAVHTDVDTTVATSDAYLTVTNTVAAADAATVPFGRACIKLGSSNGYGTDTGSTAYAAKFTAMVQTLTIAYTSGAVYQVDILWRGQWYSASTIGATDLAATNAALLANINTVMAVAGTYNVTATSGASTTITLTSDIAGEGFSVKASCTTAASLTLALTTVPVLSDITKCFAGVSVATLDNEVTTVEGSEAKYAANAGVQVMRKGRIMVASTESPTPLDKVYIITTAGSTQGTFTKTQGASTIHLPNARWVINPTAATANSIAILEIF